MTSQLNSQERILFGKQVGALKEILTDYLAFSKENLLAFNGTTTQNYSAVFLDIVARFRYNTETLFHMQESFYSDYRLKTGMNLILRSVCADILTSLYLITFYHKDDLNNQSIKNELNVISTEFQYSARDFIKVEHEFLNKLGLPQSETLEEKYKGMAESNPHLYDNRGNVKSKKELRATTHPDIKKGLNDSGKFLTEKEKYERIKDGKFSQFVYIFVLFKYYSQFQHFNSMSKNLIENKPFHDTNYMTKCIQLMLMATELILTVTQTPNTDFQSGSSPIHKKINNFFLIQ